MGTERKTVNWGACFDECQMLRITGQKSIDLKRFEIVDIADCFPIERINDFENQKYQ